MSGAVEALRHLELMALNTAQTAVAATKVNECVALLADSLTTPPARSYADEECDCARRHDPDQFDHQRDCAFVRIPPQGEEA